MKQYVALLRGINVGGRNIIEMIELKACFEKMGFGDVAAQSKLSQVIKLPIYQDMTIRNWNTTTKLLALMQARSSLLKNAQSAIIKPTLNLSV